MVGQRVKILRVMWGMTQRELAARVGVAGAYVSLLERGWTGASPDVAERLAQELRVDMRWLFGRKTDAEAHRAAKGR